MAVVADQGSVVALGQVELATRVAVIDEQHKPAIETAADGLQPVRQLHQQLGAVAVGEALAKAALQVPDG